VGVILNRSDFRGMFEVSFPAVNGRDSIVENDLNNFEKKTLIKLMGVDLFNQFSIDPINPIYAPLFAPLLNGRYLSTSIIDVVKVFVYLDYQQNNYPLATENGRVAKMSSTSTVETFQSIDTFRYNEAVQGWKSLQIYMRANYSNFAGIDKNYIFY
jgi:hypothetical protein